MNKKGVTLVELLAVIVILGIILTITIPGVAKIIKKAGMDAFNTDLNSLKKAAENYYKANTNLLPINMYEKKVISLDYLVKNEYIDKIKKPKDSSITCTGYVIVRMPQLKKYTYDPYLNCEDEFISKDYNIDAENPGIITITKGKTVELIGKDSNNILFKQENSVIELSSPIILDGDFTVEYWFKPNQANNFGIINGANENYSIYHTNLSTISLGNPSININLSSPFTINEWQHFAITRSNNFVRVYKNGKEVKNAVWTGELRPIKIGGKPNNLLMGSLWQTYNGAVSDVRIWTVVRTPQQIQTSMYYGLTGKERGLLAYWPISEGEGTVIHDVTNNYNGLLYNSEWIINNGIRRIKIDDSAWIYNDRYTFEDLEKGDHTIIIEDNSGNINNTTINIQ